MRAFLLAAACLAASAASAQRFTFTTLDNPADPTFNQLPGINDHGVIVGYFGSSAAIGDHVRLLPTPGHTPHHVAVLVCRGRDEAAFMRRGRVPVDRQ